MADANAAVSREALVRSDRSRGRRYVWLGLGLCVLGVVLAVVQLSQKILVVPWFSPILSTLGAVLVFVGVVQRAGVLRIVTLVLVTAFAGFQWFAIVSLSKLPAYEGPAQVGRKLPAFRTLLASGGTLDDRDLEDGRTSVMVFFRGRW